MEDIFNSNPTNKLDVSQQSQIVFPDDDDDGGNYQHQRSNEPLMVCVGQQTTAVPSMSATEASQASIPFLHQPTAAAVPPPVIPSDPDDQLSKRKIAGLTYFDSRKHATRREIEKIKKTESSFIAISNRNENPILEDDDDDDDVEGEKKPGAFDCKQAAKNQKEGSSDQVGAVMVVTTRNQDTDSAPRSRYLLQAMTPDQNSQKNDTKKLQRPPSYMAALDSDSFSLPDTDDQHPSIPPPPPLQSILSEPGAHSYGSQGLQLQNQGEETRRRSIQIGETSPVNQDLNNTEEALTGPELPPELADLPFALEVNDSDDHTDNVSVATPENFSKKEKLQKETNAYIAKVSAIIVLVLAAFFGGLGLGLGINRKRPDPTVAPTTNAPTTSSPSAEPIPGEVLLLEYLLPDYTLATIQEDPYSPQAAAYDWMLEELMDSSYDLNMASDPQRIIQRFALATFYYATMGDEWFTNYGWLNHSLHECLWFNQPWFSSVPYFGFDARFSFNENPNACEWPTLEPNLTYHGHQTYKHFWLYENGLQGTIPPQLGFLNGLVSMYLYKNYYTGQIPTQIGFLQRLNVLNMAVNQLTGTLPTELGVMYSLHGVSIFNAEIGGSIPSQLGQLTGLSTLKVDENLLTGHVPTEFGVMTTLNWIDAQRNLLSGPIPSELGLLKLKELNLYVNEMTGSIPSQLALLNLPLFILQKNQLSGTIPTDLGRLNKTWYLDLSANKLNGSIPTQFGMMTNIWSCWLFDNLLEGMIPSQIGLWSSLSVFWLYDNRITGTIPTELPNLNPVPSSHRGWEVDLNFAVQNNQLSGTIPANFALMIKNISAIQLTNNPLLSGTIPDELCHLEVYPSYKGVAVDDYPDTTFDCTELLCGCNCTTCLGSETGVNHTVSNTTM